MADRRHAGRRPVGVAQQAALGVPRASRDLPLCDTGFMILDVVLIAAGLVLLAIGAEGLVRGASSLALRAGITPLVVGLTVVAVATGSPELFVSIQGALAGKGGIALGNVVGSNISNLALVLGTSALVAPLAVRSELVRREMPLMIGATVLLLVLLIDGSLGRVDGFILFTSAVAYLWGAYTSARRATADEASEEYREELQLLGSKWLERVLVVAGVALLVLGADLLTRGAVSLASRLGVAPAVIALTVIAIGTSLPELATSVAAARKGEADVAFGNVIGSNTFNILGVLGIVALIRPFAAAGIRPLDYGALIGSALLVVALMVRGWVLSRSEGGLLLALYVAYVTTLVVG